LFFRKLGFPLQEITRIRDDPAFEVRAALRVQQQTLTELAVRLHALIAAVDRRSGAFGAGPNDDDRGRSDQRCRRRLGFVRRAVAML
jgi:DNA-binding transcriptional MerR regulator